MAFVILHPQKADKWAERHAAFEQDLKAHARKRLPGFACPEWVSVVQELPVSIPLLARLLGACGSCGGSRVRTENVHGEDPEGRAAQAGRQIIDGERIHCYSGLLTRQG